MNIIPANFNANVLNDILQSPTGSVTSAQLPSLAYSHGGLVLGVKMGAGARFLVNAQNAQAVIAQREAAGDYVREVFIPADTYRELRKILLGIV